jgi:hypothetical protein
MGGFLKLFGPALTFTAILPRQFDRPVAVILESVLRIVARFDDADAPGVVPRLMAYAAKRLDTAHQLCLGAFLQGANAVLALRPSLGAYISRLALEFFPMFQLTAEESALEPSLSGLFLSALEILRSDPGGKVEQAFLALWARAHEPQTRFVLLCAAKNSTPAVWQKLAESLESKSLLTSPHGVRFFVGCVALVGSALRSNDQVIAPILRHRLIPLIVDVVRQHPFAVPTAAAVLLLLQSLVEWRDRIFTDYEVVEAFFEFAEFLRRELPRAQAPGARRVLEAGLASAMARIALRTAVHDHFCRRLDSTAALGESRIAELWKLESPAVRYATVGQQLLLSVIEQASGAGPLFVIARGPFGKAIWQFSDNFTGGAPEPELAEAISRTELPQPGKLVLRPIAIGIEAPAVIGETELAAIDRRLQTSAGAEFTQWLDWPALSLTTPFAERQPYRRPRVIDLLTTLGVLDGSNRRNVRIQKPNVAEQTVAELDALDGVPICLVPIVHLMSGDTDLEFNEERAMRTTALLQQFLKVIGEPMDMGNRKDGLPKLKTYAPVIAAGTWFGAVVVPSMGATEADARAIAEQAETAVVRLIFNETGLEYIAEPGKGEQFVFVVRPSGRGFYHVREIDAPAGLPSPFAHEQTLSAQTLAFNLGLVVELTANLNRGEAVQHVVEKRIRLIGQLCTWPAPPTLTGTASAEFAEAQTT